MDFVDEPLIGDPALLSYSNLVSNVWNFFSSVGRLCYPWGHFFFYYFVDECFQPRLGQQYASHVQTRLEALIYGSKPWNLRRRRLCGSRI